MFLRKLATLFQKRPLLANMTTFGTTYMAASFSHQVGKKYLVKEKDFIDYRNVVNNGLLGYCCMGPILYGWFKCFNKILPAVSKRNIIIKVFVDLVVCSPATISIYFTSMSILEGKNDIFAELKHRFWAVVSVNTFFWVPAQVINYCFIPHYARLGYLGCALFIWMNITNIIRSQEIPLPKKVISTVALEIPLVACSSSLEKEMHSKQKVSLSVWEV